jgi:hypothetical protein
MLLGTLWSSADTDHVVDEPPTVLHDMVAGTGADLAIARAIAMDPTPDVRAYLPAVPGDGAQRPHLFLAIPHGLALLLGHLWDRMPPTLVYEDLGAGNAYQPAFLIPSRAGG